METREVVTVFLRNGGEILLLRRSDDVGSYPRRWGAVAGHAEGDPAAAAYQEIREETGLDSDEVTQSRRGDPFEVTDAALDIAWTVNPFLFDAARQDVETNWETAEAEWVHPTAIRTRETVPELWTSYDRVRPSVKSVEDDTVHGSAYISLRALEVLRDQAAVLQDEGGDWDDIASIGLELREARPEMAAVANRVNQVMYRASQDRHPTAVHEAAVTGIEEVATAERRAAERAAETVGGQPVFTLSRSGTVREALERGDPDTVRISISRPGEEGRDQATDLAAAGIAVVLTSDANVPAAVSQADMVLVGADSVLSSGAIINKVGTTASMIVAGQFGTDTYVVCTAAKIRPDGDVDLPGGDPLSLYEGPAEIAVENPIFEVTPGDLVDGIITERGILEPSDVAAIATEFEEYATWADGARGRDE